MKRNKKGSEKYGAKRKRNAELKDEGKDQRKFPKKDLGFRYRKLTEKDTADRLVQQIRELKKSEWIKGLFDDEDIKRQFEIDLRENGGTEFNQHPQWEKMRNESNKKPSLTGPICCHCNNPMYKDEQIGNYHCPERKSTQDRQKVCKLV